MPTTGIEDESSLKVPVVVGTDQLLDDTFDNPNKGTGKPLNSVNNSITLANDTKKELRNSTILAKHYWM